MPAEGTDGSRSDDAMAETANSAETPDWIPAGSVSPPVARRAVEMRARLQSTSPELQRSALTQISADINEYGRGEMRTAVVPLVVELLSQEYRILQFPRNFRVEYGTRLSALEVLARLGGEEAREQLRYSVTGDSDDSVRTRAAQLLANTTGTDPDEDLHVVSVALLAAVRSRRDEAEMYRLLHAAATLSRRVWNPEHPDLLRALIAIHDGSYSRGLRNSAISLLEELANR
jgi:hypothetical protein